MNNLRALIVDRKRRQRGSVLSAVLILVAFLAIIAGALTTEISTNFLLSHALVNRVSTEATVNSAAELYINQLQQTSFGSVCPGGVVTPVLNSQTAVASLVSCWPTVYETPKFRSVATASQPFNIDGSHAQVGGLNDYVIGNPDGTVLDYTFGSASPRWTLALNGAATGPILVAADPNNGRQWLDLIPASGSICSPASDCVSVRSDNGSTNGPGQVCAVPATGGPVVSEPAGSRSFSNIAYFGGGHDLNAIDLQKCEPGAILPIPGNQPVVAGPFAFCRNSCPSNTDEVYALVSDGGSSRLVRYTYSGGNFTPAQNPLALPWGSASGLAISSGNLPASLAITFQGGGIAVVQLAQNGSMTMAGRTTAPAGIARAPYWCSQCGNLIGVGAHNGGLYVYDSALTLVATYTPGGAAISTTPRADPQGNWWYFGTDSGYIYEVQYHSNQPVMTYANRYGPMAQIGSSVQVDYCHNNKWICVYAGAVNNTTYLVPLDSYDAVLTACIITAPPACATGVNPRLWTWVEVGTANFPRAVHVQGWSYYSP